MKATLVNHAKVRDELGNIVETKMWQVSPSPDKPHGYKYSLVYIVNDVRVIGYDNSEGQGDHRHCGDNQQPYNFTSLRQLAADFLADVELWKKEHSP
jgi:Family of unknown function (DUF6516)